MKPEKTLATFNDVQKVIDSINLLKMSMVSVEEVCKITKKAVSNVNAISIKINKLKPIF